MCGICGIAIPKNLNGHVDEIRLVQMRDTLTHRGPDDAGIRISDDRRIGLGHRRLSIVDVGGGHQPMSNRGCQGGDEGLVWLAFNGEIYNHPQLRPMLEARGHRYNNNSDTETIIHLYEERGPGAVEDLSGMFAFAVWDEAKQCLLLARDRLGIKPLYYILSENGTLYFASEIKALLAARAVAPEVNYDALADYAANRYTSGEATLFRNIKRLLPGHLLIWRDGQVRIEQYWNLSFAKQAVSLPERDYVSQFAQLFRDCVKSHLMADVPLGMFLSGGIDSSAIAGVMSGMVKEPVKTFSVAFAEREANELDFARSVAKTFRTDHHEILVSPEDFFAKLPALVYQEDEPLAHPSSVPLYFVSELARKHVKVVLTGEGSDELLAGYNKYRTTIHNLRLGRSYQMLAPSPLRRLVAGGIGSLNGSSRLRQVLQRTFLCLPPEIRDIYFDNFAVYSPGAQQRLFNAATYERMRDRDPYHVSLRYIEESDARDLLDKLLAADLKTYLHELLMKQDQMSMAASIESRVPFLDNHMIEFATAMPVQMKLRGWTTKYVLREAMKSILPKEILTRKKMGFPVPVGAWFRGRFRPILDEYVLGARARQRGIFNEQYVRELVARHEAGENHAERLWMLVNFEIWQRRFFDGEAAPADKTSREAAGPDRSRVAQIGV
jgi:asparagine synthase (glutamine-hydrolysing)